MGGFQILGHCDGAAHFPSINLSCRLRHTTTRRWRIVCWYCSLVRISWSYITRVRTWSINNTISGCLVHNITCFTLLSGCTSHLYVWCLLLYLQIIQQSKGLLKLSDLFYSGFAKLHTNFNEIVLFTFFHFSKTKIQWHSLIFPRSSAFCQWLKTSAVC